jgi:glycosyltransferase involved in cell wall biosynthesis
MLRGASIICLSSIDWAFNRQNPQELASALAESGNRVLFVENTGVRRAALRDAGRLWTRTKNWWRAHGGVATAEEGIDVFAPLLLPFPYSRAAVAVNKRVLLRVVRRWRRAHPDGPLIVITFLPTPLALALIETLGPALVVYYCIDQLAESSPGARKLRYSEDGLLAEADLVVVTSSVLQRAAARIAPRVELLPSGVRVKEFERARQEFGRPGFSPAAGLKPGLPAFEGLRGPVIGFVGSLRGATDLALVASAADLAPDLNFVMVGPLFADVRPLAARPNVRLVEAVPHTEVVRYMARFDAGMLPYVLDAFTAAVMPVKLKEYLAAGLPVVATPLPDVLRFADEHPGLVRFADDAAGFVAALRAAIADDGADAAARRMAVARQYDWSELMGRMGGWMDGLLAKDPVRRDPSPRLKR